MIVIILSLWFLPARSPLLIHAIPKRGFWKHSEHQTLNRPRTRYLPTGSYPHKQRATAQTGMVTPATCQTAFNTLQIQQA